MFVNAAVIYFLEQPPYPLFIIGLICGTAGQFGDLAESLIKREMGEKDSGHLVPGHGGVLDRFDSVVTTAPVVWFAMSVFTLVTL